MTSKESIRPTSRFLRFRLRECLVLMALIGVLLAINLPRFQGSYAERRIQAATNRLLAAAAHGDLAGVSRAIAAGADVNAFNAEHHPAMYYVFAKVGAEKRTNHELLDVLLAAGARPDIMIHPGAPAPGTGAQGVGTRPMDVAIQRNDCVAVRKLLQAGARDIGLPLHEPVANGSLEMVQVLLAAQKELGIEKNFASKLDWALWTAFESKQPEDTKVRMIELLLKNGANITYAADCAVRQAKASAFDSIRKYGAPYTPREAVAFNRLDDIKRFVEENPAILHQRYRPLYYPEVSQTLLGLALERGHREVALYLLESGAPVDVVEYMGRTLLHQAVAGGNPDLVQLLVNRGLDPNAKDANGHTPVLYSGNYKTQTEVWTILIAAGADVNAREPQRSFHSTLLHHAVAYKNHDGVKLLLDAGADPTIQDSQGRTAYDAARLQGDSELIKLLEPAIRRE